MVGGGLIIPYAEYESMEMMKQAAQTLRGLIPVGMEKNLIYAFIGDMELIGDSFGPMAGSIILSYLKQIDSSNKVYGTMEKPLNVSNLSSYKHIFRDKSNYTIVIGSTYSIYKESSIIIHRGGCRPKNIKEDIGNISILYRLADCHTIKDMATYSVKKVQRATSFIVGMLYYLESEIYGGGI